MDLTDIFGKEAVKVGPTEVLGKPSKARFSVDEFRIGERITYGEERRPGTVRDLKRARVVVELDPWDGHPAQVMRVQPYRLWPDGEVGYKRPLTQHELRQRSSEFRRRVIAGEDIDEVAASLGVLK
jgi:hypothetical protein